MREQQASLGTLGEAIDTFLKVTQSYWAGLFHWYDVADLPRTNNELEHCFGAVRYGERRASGRRGAIAALVVRGPVRVVTALALRRQCFLPRALCLQDPEAWYTLREQLTFRREARRKQWRFRKDPAAYLAALEWDWGPCGRPPFPWSICSISLSLSLRLMPLGAPNTTTLHELG